MFQITHISNDNRRKLEILNERLTKCAPEEADEIRADIAQIESTRKPLNECDFEECIELKEILFEKFNKLRGIGKTNVARQYVVMMQTVESRIATVQTEMAREIAKQQRNPNKDKAKNNNKKKQQVKKSGSSRWTVSLDEVE